jgi:hypothetical protein
MSRSALRSSPLDGTVQRPHESKIPATTSKCESSINGGAN